MTAVLHPELIRRYDIAGEIGRGGMGVVWRARDRQTGAAVALKILAPGLTDPQCLARLMREARMLGRIKSPHVVKILDAGFAGEDFYIAMELLEGSSLGSHIGGRPLLRAWVKEVLRGILRGLVAVHDLSIIHRDLKPSNVLMVDGVGAVLIDFGLARTAEATSCLTLTGEIVGTPRWLAPELVEDGDPSYATDLFAVGLIGFEALVGRNLHLVAFQDREAPTLSDILASLASRSYHQVALRVLRDHGAVGRVVLRALGTCPATRPASAAEMLEELERADVETEALPGDR